MTNSTTESSAACNLTQDELSFLGKQLRLDTATLAGLINRDFEYALENIPSRVYSEPVEPKMSPIGYISEMPFPLYVKVEVFSVAKEAGVPLDEKLYVSWVLAEKYALAYQRSIYSIDNHGLTHEARGQLYLLLSGIFHKFLEEKHRRNQAPALDFYISQAEQGFRLDGRHKLTDVRLWVDILHEVARHWRLA